MGSVALAGVCCSRWAQRADLDLAEEPLEGKGGGVCVRVVLRSYLRGFRGSL